MAGVLTNLGVAARLMLRATLRRLGARQPAPPELDAFRDSLRQRLDAAPGGLLKQQLWLDMPADQPPWVDSGVTVNPGDEVSYFMAGRIVANKALDLRFRPDLQVWCRVGERGEVFRGTRSSHSFTATTAGTVYFGNYFPSSWKNRQGELATDEAVYAANEGGFRILVVVWAASAVEGIRALLNAGEEPALADELQRLQQGETTPAGWRYLWHVGPAEIFRSGRDAALGRPCIHCHTREDVGILQHDVNLPLTPHSEISWRWRVNDLPSTIREDTVPSHDYLSIAVEFDNGRDITYYWSSSLPEGFGYDCPLPNWRGIEYHVVVRSGSEGLGEWLEERRNLYEDYQRYMNESPADKPPSHITRVWFIAVSIFQRGEGDCDYADICLHDAQSMIRLL